MKLKYTAVLVIAIILISSIPLVASGQGGFESYRSINMTGVSDSYLVIGMQGVEDSWISINQTIVITELTGVRVYPISCSFGLLRPGDIRATDPAFTLLNATNVTVNVTIAIAGDWAGITNWTHSDDCTPGVNTAGLMAIVEDGTGSHTQVIVKKTEPYNYLALNLETDDSIDFALEIHAPTEFSDHSRKENTIFIVVSEGS